MSLIKSMVAGGQEGDRCSIAGAGLWGEARVTVREVGEGRGCSQLQWVLFLPGWKGRGWGEICSHGVCAIKAVQSSGETDPPPTQGTQGSRGDVEGTEPNGGMSWKAPGGAACA